MSVDKAFSTASVRATLALSLIALVTFGWKIAAHNVTQELTILSHSQYIAEDKLNTKEILLELKDLGKKVDRLTYQMTAKAPMSPQFGDQVNQ